MTIALRSRNAARDRLRVPYAFRTAMITIGLSTVVGVGIARGPIDLSPGAALVGAAIPVIALIIIQKGELSTLVGLVAVLPLLQAPTVKLLGRVRISEVLALLLVPGALSAWRPTLTLLPAAGRRAVGTLIAYGVWSATVGLVVAITDGSLAEGKQTAYFVHPILRTSLESLRFFGAIVVVLVIVKIARRPEVLIRCIAAFVVGGAFAAAYGLYQALAGFVNLTVPLLPGTLSQGDNRPFSTLYEPTALGSFCAVSAILCLYLCSHGRRRGVWIAVLLALLAAMVVSLSRTGIVCFAAGLVGLFLFTGRRRRSSIVIACGLVILGLFLGGRVTETVTGQNLDQSYRQYRLDVDVNSRVEAYGLNLDAARGSVVGLGQGNAIFAGGGLPGWARLIREGGLPGLCGLLIFEIAVFQCLWRAKRSKDPFVARTAPYIAGASIGVGIALVNYMNVTDIWLWVPAAMAVALAATSSFRAGDAVGSRSLSNIPSAT